MMILLAAGLACRTGDGLTVHAPEVTDAAALADFVARVGHPDLTFDEERLRRRGRTVLLEQEPALGAGAYRIDEDRKDFVVSGGDLLGLQYGLAALLEGYGVRFVHPDYNSLPVAFDEPLEFRSGPLGQEIAFGQVVRPDSPLNGLQLHTLHPIEGHYDLWLPSADGLDRAERIVDWLVKNRGNYLQWPALDDIIRNPLAADAWQAHTRQIVDYAHSRGVAVFFGVQLFGTGNLQLAFDLVDGAYNEAAVDQRLDILAAAEPDGFHMSFGEFSGEDPDTFVDVAQRVVDRMHARLPDAEVTTVIHVGNYDNLRVTYQGQDQLYYFLAQYIENSTPYVHSVMYYNLFEDAGLAYLHEEFDEHRDFLLSYIRENKPVGYLPESAYWVAFDNSVPQYLPLYVRSRFTDLEKIREVGPLPRHVLFSSGWEWGYWQNDALTLRMAHQQPKTWEAPVRDFFAVWGGDGAVAAEAVTDLGDLQHQAHLVDRLAPYLAGRDAIIDVGDNLGIVSQPDRPRPSEVATLDPAARDVVVRAVDGLFVLSTATGVIEGQAAQLSRDNPVFAELQDGLAIDRLRAAFVAEIYTAALAGLADVTAAEAALDRADALLKEGKAVVRARHGALWWSGGDRLTAQTDGNATIYQFGYLAKADSLCYWSRELAEVRRVLGGTDPVPACT